MEDKKETPPPITDQLKEYAETSIKLAKYQAIEGGSALVANVVAEVAVVICFIFAFIFASITLAFYLSEVLKSYWEGFGCVALLYLLIAIVVILNKKSIEKPLINAFIKKLIK